MSVGFVVNPAMRGLRADSSMEASDAPSAKTLMASSEGSCDIVAPGLTLREAFFQSVHQRRVVLAEVLVLAREPERDAHHDRGEREHDRGGRDAAAWRGPLREALMDQPPPERPQ